MKKIISQTATYTIWLVGKESLYELVEFVVRENYKHHVGYYNENNIRNEIELVYQEELLYADSSMSFLVRDVLGGIIGSIRIVKWNRHHVLPIQKLFGINPLSSIHTEEKYNYWHIGRFAIDSFAGISTLLLFKQLMVYAINPIIQSENSYMIAEVDIKLLKTLNILGIQTSNLVTLKDIWPQKLFRYVPVVKIYLVFMIDIRCCVAFCDRSLCLSTLGW